jgi:hypothetical protein
MEVNFASMEKHSEDGKARKNSKVLIAKNLNKTKTIVALEEGIKNFLGKQNVMGIFFQLEKKETCGLMQCAMSKCYGL